MSRITIKSAEKDSREPIENEPALSSDSTTVCWFSHEKLEVYREAIAFNAWLTGIFETGLPTGDVKSQLDSASNSIPLNIAEGNGKFSPKDRCRFFDTAHGSALECAAGLDLLVAKGKISERDIRPGKKQLQAIVRMLIGLIKKNSERAYDRTPTPSSSSS